MSQDSRANHQNKTRKHLHRHREIIQGLKTQQDERRTFSERIADFLTSAFGSMGFLAVNIIWFVIWMVINIGLIPAIKPFDPFPFGLLTMIVSLEAIVLAIIVLISQNRSAKIADLREEVDLQIDLITEREITKLLELVTNIAEKQGINLKEDEELHSMLLPTSMSDIEFALEKQILGEQKEN